jgi:hypothetical protein
VMGVLSYGAFDGLAQMLYRLSALTGGGRPTLFETLFMLISIGLLVASAVLSFRKALKAGKSTYQIWYSIALTVFATTLVPLVLYVEASLGVTIGVYVSTVCFLMSGFVYLEENPTPKVRAPSTSG